MAVTFLKRSTLPAAVKGKVGTLNVMVGGNGQVILSSLATKALDGAKKVVLGFDNGTVLLFPDTAPLVKKVAPEDMIELRFAKKGGTAGFSASAILKDAATFGEHLYDYKASGNQSFPLIWNEKNKYLGFTLPKGALAPKPVTKREKKIKVTAVKAEAGKIEGEAVMEDDLVLESA